MTKQSPDSVPTAPAAPTSELASDLLPVSSTTSEPKPETKSTPAKQIVLTGEPKVTPSPEPSVTVTASPEAPPVPVLVTFPSNTQLSMGFLAGQTADDFKLMDLNGDEISLFQLLAEKPVMLQFGSYTWPPFRRQVVDSETLKEKYSGRVHFVIIYVVEAHPVGSISPYSDKEWQSDTSKDTEGNPIEQPASYDERLILADLCASDDNITSTILIDDMSNSVWNSYGPAPNLAYFIGTDHKVIEAQRWYESAKMDKVISSYFQN